MIPRVGAICELFYGTTNEKKVLLPTRDCFWPIEAVFARLVLVRSADRGGHSLGQAYFLQVSSDVFIFALATSAAQ